MKCGRGGGLQPILDSDMNYMNKNLLLVTLIAVITYFIIKYYPHSQDPTFPAGNRKKTSKSRVAGSSKEKGNEIFGLEEN